MSIFKDHGTKLIGGLTTAVGVLGSLDPTLITTLLGNSGISYLTVLAGILTAIRGFQNTKSQSPPAP